MRRKHVVPFLTIRSVLFLVVSFSLSSCGLGIDTEARLERGQKAFSDGDYRAAIIDAKNVLQDEPNNAAGRLLLGRASIELGDGVSSEKELRKAVDLGTAFSVVLLDLGRALLQQNKFDEVIADIDPELASTEADRLAVMRVRGEALIGLQQPVAAREIFTSVLAADADDIEAQLGVVKSYVAEHNYMQARETLNQVLSAGPRHIPSWLASAALNMRLQDSKRAESDYAKTVKLARDSDNQFIEMVALDGLADALLVQRKSDGAKKVLTRMVELAPDDVRTLLVTARLASVDGDWPKAQETLQEILRRAPEFRQAQMLLGYVHKESGNLGQAEMYLSSVVAAVPGNPDARKLLAETRLQMNKAEEARRALEPLVNAQGTDIGSLSMAAVASLSLGEFDVATELLERGVAEDPGNVDLRVQLAFAYFRSEQPAKAQEILEALPAAVDVDNEIRRVSLLALTQLAQEDRDGALESANALTSRWPSSADARNLAGAIEMALGDPSAARKSFSTASDLAPENDQSIRYLARLDEMESDFKSASDRHLRILGNQPNDIDSMIALARLSVRSENYTQAREWLEKAGASDPTAIVPRQLLGSLLLSMREYSDAEKVIAEALELDSTNAGLRAMMGQVQLNQGNAGGAESSFGRALELAPGDPAIRLNLARSQAMAGDSASAIVTLEESMEQTMQHLPSAVYLASLQADAGDIDAANRVSRELRESFPNESVPYALEAELHARAGDLIEASSAYDEALATESIQRYAIRSYQIKNQAGFDNETRPLTDYLEQRPFDSRVRAVLAQAYQQRQEVGKSTSEYERILKDEPENFVAANNLAWNYFVSGDERAETVARQAYDLRPENGSVVDTLGWILVNKGKLDDGIAMLRSASELGGNRPEIRYHLAAGLAAAGEKAEAKSILEEVLSSDGEFSSKSEAEGLLKSL